MALDHSQTLGFSGDFTSSEYWKEIPDDELEDFYKQLDTNYADTFLAENLSQESNKLQLSQPTPAQAAAIPVVQPSSLTNDELNDALSKTKKMIEQITLLYNQQEHQILEAKTTQVKIIAMEPGPLQSDKISEHHSFLWKLNQTIETELKELHAINGTIILESVDLFQSRTLGQKLQMQQLKIELLRQEMCLLEERKLHNSPCVAALLIAEQPIPQVVFKGKLLEDSYHVHLITGASTGVNALSSVQAKLIADEPTWKTDKPLTNCQSEINTYESEAVFSNIKVNVSTRMSAAQLQFSLQLTQSNGTTLVESPPSFPLIAITNESQWCEAEGKLVLGDAFCGQTDVDWFEFANAIHHHFLKATRQDPQHPSRALSSFDFVYIHTKFFNGQNRITQEAAVVFWNWFGHITQALRFKRHINHLWFKGLIYGIISKDDCNHLLKSQDYGTFMVRFSETCPGLFAIGYVTDDPEERVKHYLVKPEDTGSQKSLADFLREKQQFQFLYQLDVEENQMRKLGKDVALSQFYAKSKRLPAVDNGYVQFC